MGAVVLSISEAPNFFGVRVKEALKKGAMRGLYSAALRMVEVIQTQTIPAAVPQPSARGIYRAGWKAGRLPDGAYYGNALPYAGIVEDGVRPGKVKVGRQMLQALEEWVKLKGFAKGGDARRMAWAVATAMASSLTVRGKTRAGGARGIFKGSGLKILARSNRLAPQIIEEEVAREVERELTT